MTKTESRIFEWVAEHTEQDHGLLMPKRHVFYQKLRDIAERYAFEQLAECSSLEELCLKMSVMGEM